MADRLGNAEQLVKGIDGYGIGFKPLPHVLFIKNQRAYPPNFAAQPDGVAHQGHPQIGFVGAFVGKYAQLEQPHPQEHHQ